MDLSLTMSAYQRRREEFTAKEDAWERGWRDESVQFYGS